MLWVHSVEVLSARSSKLFCNCIIYVCRKLSFISVSQHLLNSRSVHSLHRDLNGLEYRGVLILSIFVLPPIPVDYSRTSMIS